jgi:hypothetical protein
VRSAVHLPPQGFGQRKRTERPKSEKASHSNNNQMNKTQQYIYFLKQELKLRTSLDEVNKNFQVRFNLKSSSILVKSSPVKESGSILNIKVADYIDEISLKSKSKQLSNAVALKRDLLSSTTTPTIKKLPQQPGKFNGNSPYLFSDHAEELCELKQLSNQKYLNKRRMPFDLLPSCSYLVRGTEKFKGYKTGLSPLRLSASPPCGGITKEGPNTKSNKKLMTFYLELERTKAYKNSRGY